MNKKHITSPLIRDRAKQVLLNDECVSIRKLAKKLDISNERSRAILYDNNFFLEADEIRKLCIYYKVNPVWLLGLEAYNYDDV